MHAAAPFVSAAADFYIAPLCSSRITLPLHPADFRTFIKLKKVRDFCTWLA
jgi:hypothetical protein